MAQPAYMQKPCPECGKPMTKTSHRCRNCRETYTRSDPMIRPGHYPPPCPACNGFGYRISPFAGCDWSICDQCRHHPGHTCTWSEWTETRGA